MPAFFACNITDNRCPLEDLAAIVVTTDFDFLLTPSAVIFLLPELTVELIELTTTRHEYLAHAAAETRNVIMAFDPTRLLVIFAEVFDFTANVAGATEEPNALIPDFPTPSERAPVPPPVPPPEPPPPDPVPVLGLEVSALAATKRISGIVTNHPSMPWTSRVQRVHVIGP